MTPDLLTYQDAADLLGVTLRRIQQQVESRCLPAEPIGFHENGRVRYGIPRHALNRPQITQIAQKEDTDQGKSTSVLAPASSVKSAKSVDTAVRRVPLTHDGVPDLAAMRAMGLGKQAAEWSRRMRIVSEFRAARRAAAPHGIMAVVMRMAGQYEVSKSAIYEWDKAWREGGPAALVPAPPPQSGQTMLPIELQLQVRQFWLNSRRPSFRQAYRHVVIPFYRDIAEDPCHISTLRRFVHAHVLPIEETYFREGRRAFEANVAPKVVRDLPPVGAVWSADHRLWDVAAVVHDGQGAGWGKHNKIKCPCGSGRERRNCCSLRRPCVTMIADVGSAAFVGWRIGVTPTAAGVCHALRSAILAFGLPKWFCPDNGKEFTAARLRGARERKALDEVMYSGVWQALGVEVHRALPFHPWSKPIESFFKAFRDRWENLAPGCTGIDAKRKPEQLDIQIRNGSLLNWDAFGEVFARQVRLWNTEHVCGHRTAAPAALYKEVTARARARELDPQTLAFLIQDLRQVTVYQQGIVLHQGGREYRFWDERLSLLIGCKVGVRWDPEDCDVAYVYPPGGGVLAIAPADNAQWGEWGEPNKQAARGRRLQKQYLKARAAEHAGATPVERLDPTGAVAMIQEREATVKAKDQAVAQADERLAALAAEQRAARAEAKSQKRPPLRTIYDEYVDGIA